MTVTPLYPPHRGLDPRHGVHDPVESTPDRALGSVRRTASIDMIRPDGVRRDLILRGRGRDLLTESDGSVRVLDEAAMDVVIDYPASLPRERVRRYPVRVVWRDGVRRP